MSFKMWDYEFEGYYIDPNRLQESPGVYVIWCKEDDRWIILDAGESDNVREQILNHDRADYWRKNCKGTIHYSATYIDDPRERADLEWRILTE